MVDRFRPKKDDSPTRKSPGKGPQGEDDSRQRMTTVGWVVVALLGFFLIQNLFQNPAEKIKMDRFLTLINDQRVTDVQIGSGTVEGTIPGGESDREVFAELPPNLEPNFLINRLERNGIEWTGRQESLWTQLLITLLPFLVLGFLYYFFFVRRLRNQLGGQGPLSFGRNKAKLYDRTDLKTTFNDVAGVDEVESEFVELFVGLGAARVRDLFQQARQRAPAIVFIDEIDSIGQARSGAAGNQLGANQEQEQTLQQLLTEMDGFEPNSGVIIVAASNRPEVLDQALLRPGRFDRQIVVNLPDIRGREEILAIHARNVKLSADVDLKVLARRTPGFSGAQLANVINEGALLSARRNHDQVSMHDLEEAIDRVVAGLERRSQVLTDKERRLVAYHELGHAIVARFVENADPVHRVA